MKKFLTFILSIVLLCAISTSFGCEAEEVDNTDYTAFLEFTEIKDGDKVTGYSVKGKEGSTETHIVIPTKYNGKPVEIAVGAFAGNNSIESVVVKNGITKMGELAFNSCRSLTEVTLPNSIMELSIEVFARCISLEEINLPISIKTIGKQSFLGCNALRSITLSRENIEIKESAFDGCINLKEVYWYEELPEGDGGHNSSKLSILNGNDYFSSHQTKWYHYSETQPIRDKDSTLTYYNCFWHYDKNGHKVIWEQN